MKTLTVLWMVAFTFALLALGAVAPAAAWVPVVDRGELNDSQEPGSFLVFPKFRAGTVNTTEEGFLPRSEFEISVVCPQGATCSQNPMMPTQVLLKAVWICGSGGSGSGDLSVTFPAQCREQNFMIPTTVNSTVYFGAQGTTPVNLGPNATTSVPPPPCERGYLVVWVVGADGLPIKYDALIGDAVLRTQTGPANVGLTTAGQYNAIPIQGSVYLNTGDPIPVDPGTGAVSFDGSGYQAVTGAIKGTVRYPGPTFKVAMVQSGAIRTSLVLLTLDVSLGFTNPPTHVDLEYSNEGEFLRSNPAQFVCWGEERLGTGPLTGMTSDFGRKGNLESGPAQQIDVVTGLPIKPATLLGLIQTQELSVAGYVLREYYYLLYNDSIPVPTDFGSVALP